MVRAMPRSGPRSSLCLAMLLTDSEGGPSRAAAARGVVGVGARSQPSLHSSPGPHKATHSESMASPKRHSFGIRDSLKWILISMVKVLFCEVGHSGSVALRDHGCGAGLGIEPQLVMSEASQCLSSSCTLVLATFVKGFMSLNLRKGLCTHSWRSSCKVQCGNMGVGCN